MSIAGVKLVKFPLFSQFIWESDAEMGSMATASTTMQFTGCEEFL
jgi:hypothetical protein